MWAMAAWSVTAGCSLDVGLGTQSTAVVSTGASYVMSVSEMFALVRLVNLIFQLSS